MNTNTIRLKISIPHKMSLFYTIFYTFFNLLPLILGIVFSLFSNGWKGWGEFYKNGEFFIYATAFLSSAFLIFYSYKKKIYDSNSYLGVICMLIIILLSAMYAIKASNLMRTINETFLEMTSWTSIFLSLYLFYRS
jgi:uncharacterized membrane protein